MATPTDSNKRQRHSGEKKTSSSNSMQLQFSDLPNALLPKVASFLSCTSCVSFAISMSKKSIDGTSSRIPSAISIAIATASSEKWESLDFKDIQEGIYGGRSSTDDDIRWVLLCIDAQNKTKSLKFTNCVGITGSGLEPMRKSLVLERVDLSLVGGYENPNINPEPPISAAVIIPILENIMNTEGSSLIHVQLPKKWRQAMGDIVVQFLERFNRMLNERRFQCSKGCGICEGSEDTLPLLDQRLGVITITCYQCMKNLCLDCIDNCEIDFCKCCEKVYCSDCNEVELCDECRGNFASCKACDVVRKSAQNVTYHTARGVLGIFLVESCGEYRCNECSSKCKYCEKSFCNECKDFRYCEGGFCFGGKGQMVACEDCLKGADCTWVFCQYCNRSYCSAECGQYFYGVEVCEGEGCKRANCNKERSQYMNCLNEHKQSPTCVRECTAVDCGSTFCTDCRVKECKKDWEGSCCVCIKMIAPMMADAFGKTILIFDDRRFRTRSSRVKSTKRM